MSGAFLDERGKRALILRLDGAPLLWKPASSANGSSACELVLQVANPPSPI